MTRPNFIRTLNPFGLADPPAWFLSRLRAYDPSFVLFPSEKEPLYRCGRYGRYGHGILSVLKSVPDTKIYVAHGIWPWKSIMPQAIGFGFGWSRVLLDLPNYDTQRFSAPDETLDNQELAAEQANDRAMADEADQRAADFYRTLKLVDGSRIGSGSRPEGAGYQKVKTSRAGRPRAYRPLGAGSGAIFVGR